MTLHLSATSSSRRVLVLEFIRRYFAEYGQSPTQGEIAAALATDASRVRAALRTLERQRLIRRSKGATRGIELPKDVECIPESAAILRLRMLGWTVNRRARNVAK